MARKFKKKLAPKKIVKKTKTPVLSVELVRKETLIKIKNLYNKAYKFLINKNTAS